MLTLLTVRQERLIVKNVLDACKDIEKLNKTGYNFLYLSSGFIAHYDLGGFISYYEQESLKKDILDFAAQNTWTNFQPGEENYEYYHQKARIYKMIVDGIKTIYAEQLQFNY